METHTKTTPRDFFLHLLTSAMLYAAAISWSVLMFQIINIAFPDILNSSGYQIDSYYSVLRGALSWFFITFPVYMVAMRYLKREYVRYPEKLMLWIRRWLTYFTLFVASLIIIGDIIFLFNTFLDGELTIRFVLKVIAVLFIAGSIFGYYIWDIRQDVPEKLLMARYIGYGMMTVFAISLIGGFFFIGSPQTQRMREADRQRVNDLSNAESEIITYWQKKDVLPQSLKELENSLSYFTVPQDPETKEPYAYKITGDLSFELCAVFVLPSTEADQSFDSNSRWNHEGGEVCFQRTIDPDLYKPDDLLPRPALPLE
ncbi:MAG: DUF5671 domain-containing protein [bacterium]